MSNNGKGDMSVLEKVPIRAWPWPRIVAFVPLFPALPFADDVFYNFIQIAQQGVPFLRMKYGRTDYARNKATEAFLAARFPDGQPRYTHLLMLDADHMHPQHIVQKLARWVIADPARQVIGGMNFKRAEPYDPCCFVRVNDTYYHPYEWTPGLMKVDLIGTGCILIAREVFEAIDPPWFYYPYEGVKDDNWPTEDVGFSLNCQKAGVDLWVDTGTTSPHMTSAWIDENTHRTYIEEHKDELTAIEAVKED